MSSLLNLQILADFGKKLESKHEAMKVDLDEDVAEHNGKVQLNKLLTEQASHDRQTRNSRDANTLSLSSGQV